MSVCYLQHWREANSYNLPSMSNKRFVIGFIHEVQRLCHYAIFLGKIKGVVDSLVVLFKALYNTV